MPNARNSKVIRVAAYARVSTGDQHLDNQLAEIEATVKSRGWKLVATHTDVMSGAKDTRPGLNRLLQQVAASEVDVVVVVRLDRLGRSLRHLLAVIEQITNAGVDLVSIRDAGIDTTTATGKLMVSIIGAFACFERDMLIERTRAGMQRARREGRVFGRPRVDVAVEAASRLLDQGHSLRAVARMLNVSRATMSRRLAEGGPQGSRPDQIADAA
jgi:DNA invertase Pin-like site-specific DNA recombinase